MGRRPRVDRTPEEKWQIVQEGIKSGNVSETCRRHGISPSLLYRWRDEAEEGAKAALGGQSKIGILPSDLAFERWPCRTCIRQERRSQQYPSARVKFENYYVFTTVWLSAAPKVARNSANSI